MNYEEAVAFIESLHPTQVKPGLERFAIFMSEHGELQNRQPSLHVGGTNGKGSVCSMLAETLNRAGWKTGKYTGPHLMSLNERFEFQGEHIPDEELAKICTKLKMQSEQFAEVHPARGPLTWFEILTAIAFVYFARSGSDVSVFEVGLGGRWDATNVLRAPIATGIVTVSLDHTHILGPTVSDIAREKAGILKAGVPLVTGCRGAALTAIVQEAEGKNVPIICVGDDATLSCASGTAREKHYVDALNKRFSELSISVPRSVRKQQGYQKLNAGVAAAILGIWEMETSQRCLDSFDEALCHYFWPGRLQYFKSKNLILDGAHNEDGARALKQSLDELFPSKRRAFVLCFYQSKQFTDILSALLRPGDLVFASQTTGRRSVVPSEEIVRTARALGAEASAFGSLDEAFKAASELPDGDFIRIGGGSFVSVVAGLNFLGYDNVLDSQSASNNLWQPA